MQHVLAVGLDQARRALRRNDLLHGDVVIQQMLVLVEQLEDLVVVLVVPAAFALRLEHELVRLVPQEIDVSRTRVRIVEGEHGGERRTNAGRHLGVVDVPFDDVGAREILLDDLAAGQLRANRRTFDRTRTFDGLAHAPALLVDVVVGHVARTEVDERDLVVRGLKVDVEGLFVEDELGDQLFEGFEMNANVGLELFHGVDQGVLIADVALVGHGEKENASVLVPIEFEGFEHGLGRFFHGLVRKEEIDRGRWCRFVRGGGEFTDVAAFDGVPKDSPMEIGNDSGETGER